MAAALTNKSLASVSSASSVSFDNKCRGLCILNLIILRPKEIHDIGNETSLINDNERSAMRGHFKCKLLSVNLTFVFDAY